jgi:guanylate kinase
MTTPLLIVISGPSGVGKDTVTRRLFELAPDLKYSVSYTTRPRRSGEVDGKSYSFVSEDEFQRLVDAGEFLEWAKVHDHRYGTSRRRVQAALDAGHDVLLKIDVQGAMRVRKQVPEGVFIFMTPPSIEALIERLMGRNTEDPASLERRQRDALQELGLAREYRYIVCNREVDRTAREVLDIIALEHTERQRKTDR